ncbi:hypothetical protein SAMN05192553_1209 [Cyclobacterium xiamenense]|uniref:DoxX protein n=1 Tax=Cyclobacterium xiamenense TaxID=1297121 RepID=A0A1H7BYQ1_9BACT|nr:hypothetical protein [Cyclobacterium xiamenense]SEJ82336.1 hypothetical protein SAMN05192553_1209 [Cyclobacterium xiamenense]
MKTILNLGKWLFILPFAVFGFLHFGPLEFTIDYIPDYLPFKVFWIYFSGACLIAFAASAAFKKFDKLASVLLALELILFVLLIHIPKAIEGDFVQFIGIFRDTVMAGAALIYAKFVASDQRFVK